MTKRIKKSGENGEIRVGWANVQFSNFSQAHEHRLSDTMSSVCCLTLQPSQPLPGILDFGEAWVGVLTEVKDTIKLLNDFPTRLPNSGNQRLGFPGCQIGDPTLAAKASAKRLWFRVRRSLLELEVSSMCAPVGQF